MAGVPESSVDEFVDPFREITGVTEIIEECEASPDDALQIILRHMTNRDLRFQQALKQRSSEELATRLNQLELQMRDVRGESGSNGKLGNVTALVKIISDDVSKITARAWAVFLILLGGVGAAAIKLVIVGKAYGDLETSVDSLNATVDRHQAEILLLRQSRRFNLPASPEKEPAP